MDFKWRHAIPAHAFEREFLTAPRSPTARRPAIEHRSIGVDPQRHASAFKTFAEHDGGSLIEAIDLLQKNPGDIRVALISDEHLTRERTEFSDGGIGGDAAGGSAQAPVRQEDSRGHQLGHPLAFNDEAAIRLR